MICRRPYRSEIEYVMRDDDRNREIIYFVAYTCYPVIPATHDDPEEGGPELDGGDVVGIRFLDRDGDEIGEWNLACNTLTQAEADMIEKHYEKDFARHHDEALAECIEYESSFPEQDPDDPDDDR